MVFALQSAIYIRIFIHIFYTVTFNFLTFYNVTFTFERQKKSNKILCLSQFIKIKQYYFNRKHNKKFPVEDYDFVTFHLSILNFWLSTQFSGE